MKNFVTIFNKDFIPQGIALYKSMCSHMSSFKLWIICVDSETFNFFNRNDFNNIIPLHLIDLETDKLKKLRTERSLAEYCWTITPFAPKFVFDHDHSIDHVTYIDADIYFINNPEIIFKEFKQSTKSVLITEHAYNPDNDHSKSNGRFCVQFIIFKRNSTEDILRVWQDQCLEWCFARYENGKFGDQMYLDDWDKTFKDKVHVLKEVRLALAPWNAQRFSHSEGVFWHFHGFKFGTINNSLFASNSDYYLPKLTRKNIYAPYKNLLSDIISEYSLNSNIDYGYKIIFIALKRKLKRAIKAFIELFF